MVRRVSSSPHPLLSIFSFFFSTEYTDTVRFFPRGRITGTTKCARFARETQTNVGIASSHARLLVSSSNDALSQRQVLDVRWGGKAGAHITPSRVQRCLVYLRYIVSKGVSPRLFHIPSFLPLIAHPFFSVSLAWHFSTTYSLRIPRYP